MPTTPLTSQQLSPSKQRVICILGPTGAGKTAASLGLATAANGVIVNIDSRQVYADFPIITAQPTPQEQKVVPHYLYGFLATTQSISAGEYARQASRCMDEQIAQKKLPILVGGTGLFIRTLFSGIAPIPDTPLEIRVHWQEELAKQGSPALHAQLSLIDPAYAQKIHPNDKQRVTRALEVFENTGKTFTWWHEQPVTPSAYEPFFIGIKRSLDELTPRLEQRIIQMLEMGALEEAQRAFALCKDADAPGWTGIGCAELYAYITEQMPLDEAMTLWLKNTRAYAKRQLTWFNSQKDIHWFKPDDDNAIVERCLDWLNSPRK